MIVNIIEILVVVFIINAIVIRAIIKRVFLLIVKHNLTIAVQEGQRACSNNIHPRSISRKAAFLLSRVIYIFLT